MVGQGKSSPKMESTYYLKHGQTLENTKVADRSLALKLSKSEFNRFVDYTTENERLAAAAAEEAAKLAALKKKSYEMTKSWGDTIANIKKKRKQERFDRVKRDEEIREEFVKNTQKENAIERAGVVNEARNLLLWKKPQCRLINSALLTAECYRELNAQLAFNKSLRDIDKKEDSEYVRMMKEDVEKFNNEERKKAEMKRKKSREYAQQLKRQIGGVGDELKRLELKEREMEKQDLKNMAREIETLEKCEAQEVARRKKEQRKIFLDALEEKKRRQLELKRKDKYENGAIEIVKKSKERIKKIAATRLKEEREEKIRNAELLAKKCAAVRVSHEAAEEEIRKKVMMEKEKLEREREQEKIKKQKMLRADMAKYRKELAAMQKNRDYEEKNIADWETIQRFKRDEFNKKVKAEEIERERKKKRDTAAFLQKQIAEREAELKLQEDVGNEATLIKRMIESTNEKVLKYGQEVLKECVDLNRAHPNGPHRPLFPILKAIETFKKESGLIPPKQIEEAEPPKRRRMRRKRICANVVPPEDIIYV
ncbi:trichohyalin-like [Venturia canescens]|uniref:trichohyalin-like n=1 Tax=Venturia canescens TaxID=32260 RepID=UPI001C9C364F|nr:trichohyalin-like [Venturia canescens]